MLEAHRRHERHRFRVSILAIGSLLLGLALLPWAKPVAAQALPKVHVYRSPDNRGAPESFRASTGRAGAQLVSVDSHTGTATAIGAFDPMFGSVTEVEFRDDGVLFGATGGGASSIITIDPSNGHQTLVGTHVFGAVTGLEFVGSTLYGTFIEIGGGSALSKLVTVNLSNLDPAPGEALTVIGEDTGISGPIGGLAFDPGTGTMYGAVAGRGESAGDLVTIDLSTGVATPVGSTNFGEVAALEFSASGVLFGGLGGNSSAPGSLITIDPASGAGTLVGPSGFPVLSGLASLRSSVIQDGAGLINLWIDGGRTSSLGSETVCMMGNDGGSGHELCGADILIQLVGETSFTNFKVEPDMREILVHHPACEVFDDETGFCTKLPDGTKQLRMNFRRGGTAPLPKARRLGALFVNVVDPAQVTLTRVTAASANLQLREAGPEPIAVPEPGEILMLTSGVLGLAFLKWFRRRR